MQIEVTTSSHDPSQLGAEINHDIKACSVLIQWLSKTKSGSDWNQQRNYSDKHAHCGITEPGGCDGEFVCKFKENNFLTLHIAALRVYLNHSVELFYC